MKLLLIGMVVGKIFSQRGNCGFSRGQGGQQCWNVILSTPKL